MKPETTVFRVSWSARGHNHESRRFTDSVLASEFYTGIVQDAHTTEAKLVETIDRELRFFERQHTTHPAEATM